MILHRLTTIESQGQTQSSGVRDNDPRSLNKDQALRIMTVQRNRGAEAISSKKTSNAQRMQLGQNLRGKENVR